MEIKLSIVIASHLSDMQIEMSSGNAKLLEQARQRANFIKLLIFRYPDLTQHLHTDELDKVFREANQK